MAEADDGDWPLRLTPPGPALFVGESWPLEQLWLFWVAPIAGAIIGALIWRFLLDSPDSTPEEEPEATAAR